MAEMLLPVRNRTAESKALVAEVREARRLWESSRVWLRQTYLVSLGGCAEARRDDYGQAIDGSRNLAPTIGDLHRGLCMLATIERSDHGSELVDAVIEGNAARAEYHAARYLEEVSNG